MKKTPWLIQYTLHPALLAGSLTLWWFLGKGEEVSLLVLLLAQVVLAIAERFWPAKQQWRQRASEKATIVGITLAGFLFYGLVLAMYELALSPGLTSLRQSMGLNLWPTQWPLLIQVVLAYFSSELIYYWIHRGMHRFQVAWRSSGHAFHHSFQNLHAINFLTAHPLEVLFLTMPVVVLGALFGADPGAMVGASVLLIANASFVHSNIDCKSGWVGLLVTTNAQHRRHHSNEFAASNSNYSCNAIVWDRLFGTYSEGPVKQTGIGPTEPSLIDKLLLPIRQPAPPRKASKG